MAQAALTGESLPVEERHAARRDGQFAGTGEHGLHGHQRGQRLGHRPDRGHRRRHTFGQLAGRVTQTARVPTQFQQGINRVSWVLIRFMLVMAPIVMLINGFTKGDWLEALLFALAIAVGLTPRCCP